MRIRATSSIKKRKCPNNVQENDTMSWYVNYRVVGNMLFEFELKFLITLWNGAQFCTFMTYFDIQQTEVIS